MSRIGAYIITLSRSEERRADATALATALGSTGMLDEIALQDAVDWKDRAGMVAFLNRHPEHTFRESFLCECLLGQVAVACSHIATWRRLLESGLDGAIVFEDDMQVTDPAGFAEIVTALKQRPDIEWARLHLHKMYRADLLARQPQDLFVDDPFAWGFAGYYFSRRGAEKLVRLANNIGTPIDYYPPMLRKRGLLDTKTVTRITIDHTQFEGQPSELADRKAIEKRPDTLQKSASNINSSPRLANDAEFHRFISRRNHVDALRRHGVTVLRGAFERDEIAAARDRVLRNVRLLRNTRPTPSSGHLAGFHRHPELEPLHTMLTGNPGIRQLVEAALGGEDACAIGLTDITLNRSQPWHADLLRGRFRHHLDGLDVWNPAHGGVFKVLAYLNDTDSLKVVRGSHLQAIDLASDASAVPADDAQVAALGIKAGDVVVMDIRCVHRGADEETYQSGKWDRDPRILVSTVLGGGDRALTRRLEAGNFERLLDWQDRWRDAPPPCIAAG